MNYSHDNIKTWPKASEIIDKFKINPKSDTLPNFWSGLGTIKPKLPQNLCDEFFSPMTSSESAKIIKFVMNRVLKALPTDTARLFFLQSELLAPEFEEFKQGSFYYPKSREYEYDYYCEVQRQLKTLKEKTHGKTT